VRIATRVVAAEVSHNEGRVEVVRLLSALGLVEANQGNMARDGSRDILVESWKHTAGFGLFWGVRGHLRRGFPFLAQS
jgi:hypothetical protein